VNEPHLDATMDMVPLTPLKHTLQTQPSLGSEQQTSRTGPRSEFDPCSNAKVASPFYLYNHDPLRPSCDTRPKSRLIRVAIQDLEAGNVDLAPTITQEKRDAQKAVNGRFRWWSRRKESMTGPKPRGCVWLARVPPWQRLLIKIAVALLMVGAIVGIAVGISVKVHGGVYTNSDQMAQIGS